MSLYSINSDIYFGELKFTYETDRKDMKFTCQSRTNIFGARQLLLSIVLDPQWLISLLIYDQTTYLI